MSGAILPCAHKRTKFAHCIRQREVHELEGGRPPDRQRAAAEAIQKRPAEFLLPQRTEHAPAWQVDADETRAKRGAIEEVCQVVE